MPKYRIKVLQSFTQEVHYVVEAYDLWEAMDLQATWDCPEPEWRGELTLIREDDLDEEEVIDA